MADRPVLEDEASLPCLGLASLDGDAGALAARYRLLAKNVRDFVEHGADFVVRKHALLDQGFQDDFHEGNGGKSVGGCSEHSETGHVFSDGGTGSGSEPNSIRNDRLKRIEYARNKLHKLMKRWDDRLLGERRVFGESVDHTGGHREVDSDFQFALSKTDRISVVVHRDAEWGSCDSAYTRNQRLVFVLNVKIVEGA
jgi:hypothetical protein